LAEIIRVEPLSTCLEKWKTPTSAVTRQSDTAWRGRFDIEIGCIAAV
jgi:2-iminobutanoate/2-iminopropanoate deaminase